MQAETPQVAPAPPENATARHDLSSAKCKLCWNEARDGGLCARHLPANTSGARASDLVRNAKVGVPMNLDWIGGA